MRKPTPAPALGCMDSRSTQGANDGQFRLSCSNRRPGMGRTRNQGSNWIRPVKRLAIYMRDGFCCAYCGANGENESIQLTLDHLIPCESGGSNHQNNLITACLSCNSSKKHQSLTRWYAVLKDRGVQTSKMGARIRRLVKKPLDRKAAKVLYQERIQY